MQIKINDLLACPTSQYLSLHYNNAKITSLTKKDKNNVQKHFWKFDSRLMIDCDAGEK